MHNIMEKYNMMDVWRERNGMKREYSRRQIVDRVLKQSRIDLFYAKKGKLFMSQRLLTKIIVRVIMIFYGYQ